MAAALNFSPVKLTKAPSSVLRSTGSVVAKSEIPVSLLKGEANAHVYLGVRNGKAVYVGITKDVAARQSAHADRFVLQKITTDPVTRRQARAIEQNLIERNPQFENKINSISSRRSWYQDAKDWGAEWLKSNGY